MPPVFCFIDDAEFELNNFAQNAAPGFWRAQFVYATSFAQARHLLKGRRPLCFLLDLYGADCRAQGAREPSVPDFHWINQRLPEKADAAGLYQGLCPTDREAGNLFLRRLYAQVEKWQKTFQEAAAELKQSRAFGLANLAAVRGHFPWAAAVGYSRKALYADAVAVSLAGIDGVLQKPQGADDAAIAQATRAAAPGLVKALYQAVDRRLASMIAPLALRLSLEGGGPDLVKALGQALSRLGAARVEPWPGGLSETLKGLASDLALKGVLAPPEKETILALGDWLASM